MRDANEAFLTNSTWELRPVETVDGIEVGDGPVTKLLSRLYDDYVERRHYGGDGAAMTPTTVATPTASAATRTEN